ncbi:outer membrane beta-barrel protein [Pontibacter cellulosilyticus]|nr:outer membrane beta-barrel protein [Pontibacter cellulosilyticus]
MLFDRELVVTTDTVFLRALVKGAVSLFRLQYEKGEPHYFIQKGDEVPVELIYRTTRLENKQQVGFTKVPVYKGMLTVKLADCAEVSKKINGVEFSKNALTHIIQDYNKCIDGNEGEYLAKEEKSGFALAAIGGITYNFLKIKGDADETVNSADLNEIGYTAGASFQFTFPRNHGRYSLLAEVMYKPLKIKGTYKEVNPADKEVYVLTTANYDMDYAGLNILGRVMFGTPSKIRPYINAGLGNNLMLANNSHQLREVHIYSNVTTYENQMSNVRKFEESLILGVGAESKRFASEIRYERGSGFSPVGEIKTIRNAVALKLSYNLFQE